MKIKKLKYISEIVILFLLVLAGSPLFNIHIHHELQSCIEEVNQANKYKANICWEHKDHGCQPELFFEHLFENGARIETGGNYFSNKEINYYDEQANINYAPALFSSYIINRVHHDNHFISDFLITIALNPRSPPAHS